MGSRATGPSAGVERVEVFSNWLGYARPPTHSAKLVITGQTGQTGRRFARACEPSGPADELPAEGVDELVSALSRPAVKELDPSLFPHLPEPVLRSHYRSRWTDDHPEVLVRVIFAGGRTVSVHTEAQQAYMLPLTVKDSANGKRFKTFDPALSRAVAALLPEKFLNKERLGGEEGLLRYHLDQYAKEQRAAAAGEAFDEDDDEETRKLLNYRHPDPLSEPLLRDGTTIEEVRRLLAAGANPSVEDDVGQSALMHASYRRDAERFRVLVAAGARVEARRDGLTGLHLAALGGEGEMTALWLEAGADLHAVTPDGETALMLGARWPEVLDVLLRAGADVNAVDRDGRAALVFTILEQCGVWPHGQLRAMRMLIDAGADLNRRDRDGLTPLGHARRKLAEERMAREVREAIGAASAPDDAAPPDPARYVDPDTHESALGWSDLRMAAEVVKLMESAGGRE